MADQKIGDAANGTKSTLDGTEKIPITGTKNALVSGIKDYAKTIFDTLYSAFNHSHADSDNGGIVNHTVLTNAGTSLHVPTYSSDSTTFLNGMGEWTVPAGGVTLSSDSTQYYNGIGEFTVVTDALLSFTDITTNNVSISKHGFTPKLSADSTLFLNGQGEWTVPPGTAGGITYSSDSTEYLNGKGEFTVPAGGGGGGDFVKLATHTSSGAADIQLLSWKNDSLYDVYTVKLYNIIPATDNVEIELQFSKDGGSTWEATNYAWTGLEKYIGGGIQVGADSGQSYIKLATSAGNATYKDLTGSFDLMVPGSANHKSMLGSTRYWTYAGNQINWDVIGDWLATNAIDGIRILASSGNISGTATIYGLTK